MFGISTAEDVVVVTSLQTLIWVTSEFASSPLGDLSVLTENNWNFLGHLSELRKFVNIYLNRSDLNFVAHASLLTEWEVFSSIHFGTC